MTDALLKCQDDIERLEKENMAMREAIKEVYGSLFQVLLSFDLEKPVWVTRDVPAGALAKLQPFLTESKQHEQTKHQH